MTIKVTIPNTSSDSLTFGSGNTPTAAQVIGIDSGSSNGQLAFNTTASGTSTERMRIDASGNVGIGTSSPSTYGGKLAVRQTTDQLFFVSGNNLLSDGVSLNSVNDVNGANKGLELRGSIIGFTTQGTERARIDTSGKLIMATSTDGFAGQMQVGVTANTGSVNGAIAVSATSNGPYPIGVRGESTIQGLVGFFNSSNTLIGSIFKSSNTVAYNTSSDYRLKENIAQMTGALSVVQQLKPVTYTWKVDGSDGQGFIAHELQAVVPECVTGEKDAVDTDGNPKYQGIDTSFLVATLTAAIQELKAELDAAKADIATLKGQA